MAEVSTAVPQKGQEETPPLRLTVHGKTYDLTEWGPSHPGGPLLYMYHDRDCTQVFDAFHQHESTRNFLEKNFPSTPSTLPEPKQDSDSIKRLNGGKPVNPKQILIDFDLLTQELHNKGFFKSNPMWFAYKLITSFAMAPLAYWLNISGYPVLGCIVLATMWQQFGWISHEINHHSVFPERWQGHLMGWISGNVWLGFSMWWWNDRHNSHHAVTNIEDQDPDIETLPFLCFSEKDAEKATPEQRAYIQYQHYYFWFVLPFLNLIWMLNSIMFAATGWGWANGDMKKPEQIYTQYNRVEIIGLAIHHFGMLWFMFTSLDWWIVPVWWIAAKIIAGTGLAFVVFFNHYSCPKFDFDSDAGENFVINQLITTRNLTPGILADWLCGGLNYQIEHHLWPTIPRHNLYKVSLILREWCEAHNLPYLCSDFIPGVIQVRDYLKYHADYAKSFEAKRLATLQKLE